MQVPSTVLADSGVVDEVTDAALAINEAVRADLDQSLERKRSAIRKAMAVGAVGVAGGVFLAATGAVTAGLGAMALGAIVGIGYGAHVRSQTPDVQVKGVEKRYWTTHLLPQRNGTIVYDATNVLPSTELELREPRDPSVFGEARRQFDDIDELPIVVDEDDDVETEVRTALDQVRRELEGAERNHLSAPLVEQESNLVRTLDQLSAYAVEGSDDASTVQIDLQQARQDVDAIETLENTVAQDDAEENLQRVKESAEPKVTELLDTQRRAIELLNDHIDTVSDTFTLRTFNFYCRTCLSDDVESLLEYDGEEWRCETCRSAFEGTDVVPKHRMKDELIEDVIDQLWIEKDDERRRVYENIEDQKAELKEREFEQCREEIRNVGNRIQDLRSKIRDLRTEAEAGVGKIEETGDLMVKYDRLREERKESFQRDVQQAIDRIDDETEQIMEETRNVQQERLEKAEAEAEERAEMIRIEEQRREREKFLMEQRLAQQRHEQRMVQSARQNQRQMAQAGRQQQALKESGASAVLGAFYGAKSRTTNRSAQGGD